MINMAINNDRVTILGVQPSHQYKEFQNGGFSDNTPITGGGVIGVNFDEGTGLGRILTALGVNQQLTMDKDDLLHALVQGFGLAKGDDLYLAIMKYVNLLDSSIIQELNNRLSRFLRFFSPDSELCKLLNLINNFEFGNITLVLSAIFSFHFEFCKEPQVQRLLGKIQDVDLRRSVAITLLGDGLITGNPWLVIDVINDDSMSGAILDEPDIIDIIINGIHSGTGTNEWGWYGTYNDVLTEIVQYTQEGTGNPFVDPYRFNNVGVGSTGTATSTGLDNIVGAVWFGIDLYGGLINVWATNEDAIIGSMGGTNPLVLNPNTHNSFIDTLIHPVLPSDDNLYDIISNPNVAAEIAPITQWWLLNGIANGTNINPDTSEDDLGRVEPPKLKLSNTC